MLLCAGCTYEGDSYKHGDTWKPYGDQDPCFECACKDGDFECQTINCPFADCDDAVAEVGECCPKCPGNSIAIEPALKYIPRSVLDIQVS